MSDESNKADNDEFDQLVEGLQRIERARARKIILITLAFAILGGVSLVAVYVYREALFVPELGIEEGEVTVLAETNDPQCRAFIADVTAIGERFSAAQPELEKSLVSDDPTKIRVARDTIQKFRDDLVHARVLSGNANLRFEDSARELGYWFDYTDNELRVLDSVAQNALERLEPKPDSAEDAEPQVVDLQGTKKAKKLKLRPAKERIDGALLASDDAFQNFRVWHTASLHPCGKADEGETPWTPESELVLKAKTPSK